MSDIQAFYAELCSKLQTTAKGKTKQSSLRALSVMAGLTSGLVGSTVILTQTASQMQNDGTPMPHLLAGGIGSNDVTSALVPVVRV